MKCPYCAETIKDDAIVCRLCDNNLSVFKLTSDPVISPIKNSVAELNERLTKVEDAHQTVDPAHWSRIGWVCVLSGAIPALLVNLYLLNKLAFFNPLLSPISYGLIVLIVHIPVLLAALWAGLPWKGTHGSDFLLLGLLVTFVELTVHSIFVLYHLPNLSPSRGGVVFYLGPQDLIGLLGTALLFWSGGLIADAWHTYQDWKSYGPTEAAKNAGLSGKIAARFSGSGSDASEKVLLTLKVVGPLIVTLISALIKLYFGNQPGSS